MLTQTNVWTPVRLIPINWRWRWVYHRCAFNSLTRNWWSLLGYWSLLSWLWIFKMFNHHYFFHFISCEWNFQEIGFFENLRWLWTPCTEFFQTLPKVVSCLSKVDDIKKFHRAVFELKDPKAVIKGVFKRSYCCFGNLLCQKNDCNVFTNDWAIFWYHDCSIEC